MCENISSSSNKELSAYLPLDILTEMEMENEGDQGNMETNEDINVCFYIILFYI